MAEKIDEIELDLGKVRLDGWQFRYCPLNVKALRIARDLGHQLPRVDVIERGGIYRLVYGCVEETSEEDNYGGHSRSRLAFEDERLLECNLFDDHRSDPGMYGQEVEFIPISEMFPRVYWTQLGDQLQKTLGHLPEAIRNKFMEENDLVIVRGVLNSKHYI